MAAAAGGGVPLTSVKLELAPDRDAHAIDIEARVKTTGRTGVLIYLSMREHRAEIVADESIAAKVSAEVWGEAMGDMHRALADFRQVRANSMGVAVWRDLFDFYVFSGGDEARAHIPEEGQGALGPIDAQGAARIHQFILRSLSQ